MKKLALAVLTIASTGFGAACILQPDHFLGMCLGLAGVVGFLLCFVLEQSIEDDRYEEEMRKLEERRRQIMIEQMDLVYLDMDL